MSKSPRDECAQQAAWDRTWRRLLLDPEPLELVETQEQDNGEETDKAE